MRPPLNEQPLPEYTFGSQNIGPTAIRVGSGIVGGAMQGLGGPLGSLGSMASTALGEDLAQRAEMYEGIRESPDLGRVGVAALTGAVPFPALRSASQLAREVGQAAFNTALPVGMVAAENLAEGRPQSGAELATAGGLGLLMHGGMRTAGAALGSLTPRARVQIEGQYPMEQALGPEAGATLYWGRNPEKWQGPVPPLTPVSLNDVHQRLNSKQPWMGFVTSADVPLERVQQFHPDAMTIVRTPQELELVANSRLTYLPEGTQLRFWEANKDALGPEAGAAVYHGTPHTWPPEPGYPVGRPTLEKVRTGTGGMAQGHGFYVAQAPGTGKYYQEILPKQMGPTLKLSEPEVINHLLKHADNLNPEVETPETIKAWMKAFGYQEGDPDSLASAIRNENMMASGRRINTDLANKLIDIPKGNLYTLDVPDEHLDKMLDWDKPLNQQSPEVQKVLLPIVNEFYKGGNPNELPNITGREFYEGLAEDLGHRNSQGFVTKSSPEAASQYLFSKGIPGNKYLDAMSRDKNFVPDLEGEIKIIKQKISEWESKKPFVFDAEENVLASLNNTLRLRQEALEKAKNPSYNLVLFDPSIATPIARNDQPVPLSVLTGKESVLAPILPPDVRPIGHWEGMGDQYNLRLPDGTETTFTVTTGGDFAKTLAAKRKEFSKKLGGGGSVKDLLGSEKGMALIGQPVPPKPNAMGFYSRIENAVDNLPEGTYNPQSLASKLGSGVASKVELEETGTLDWLRQQKGKVSKQQVQDYVRSHRIEVEEHQLGDTPRKGFEWAIYYPEDYEEFAYRGAIYTHASSKEQAEISAARMNANSEWGQHSGFTVGKGRPAEPAQYSQWTQPFTEGAEPGSYRELVFTLPPKGELAREQYDFFPKTSQDLFHGQHYSDMPNTLGWTRFDTRTGPNGEKMLFLHEVQSDWGQKGREHGFMDSATPDLVAKKNTDFRDSHEYDIFDRNGNRVGGVPVAANPEQAVRLWNQQAGLENRVPSMPFKSDWHELLLKRMLRYAAEHGYDKIAWTTGEQQAERYDLSKHIDKLRVSKFSDGWELTGTKDGVNIVQESFKDLSKLAQYVGKDMAKKAVENIGDVRMGTTTFEGPDLKIGGHGMTGFYGSISDKGEVTPGMVGSFLNGYSKKMGWGAKVEQTNVSAGGGKTFETGHGIVLSQNWDGEWEAIQGGRTLGSGKTPEEAATKAGVKFSRPAGPKVHSITVTPQMKRDLLEKGQPIAQAQPQPFMMQSLIGAEATA